MIERRDWREDEEGGGTGCWGGGAFFSYNQDVFEVSLSPVHHRLL